MQTAADLAQQHWNETPLFVTATERYSLYPWLPKVAEFSEHRGERILEVGCGTGCDLLEFAANGAIATGIDISDVHLVLARKRIGEMAAVLKADARAMPFPDQSFDYVYSHGVIHHSDQPRRIVAEIFRVLKAEGRFNVHLYAAHSYNLWRAHRQFPSDWKQRIENSTAPVHIEFYSNRDARKLFRDAHHLEIRKTHISSGSPLLQRTLHAFDRFLGYYVIIKGERPTTACTSAASPARQKLELPAQSQ